MESIREILSTSTRWELAPRETRYSCDQVIDAYLKGKSDGIQQSERLIAKQLDGNVNKTVEETNRLVAHLTSSGFHPVSAYLRIDDWDTFTLMVTVPDDECCDPRFLPMFDYVIQTESQRESDFYSLEIQFCGLPAENALNEPAVFADGFILKLNIQ